MVALGRAECDIADAAEVRRRIAHEHPDIVFNVAAYTAVDLAESQPEAARLINALAPGWIAEAVRDAGARGVFVSSDFVFAGDRPRPLRPDDPVGPLSVYGRSKREGEAAVANADPDALIVRTAWVYAAHGNNFFKTMLRLMTERTSVSVVADQIGTPTHAPSLARALWSLAAAGATGIHHYTDSGVASWYDFAVAIHEEALALHHLDRPVDVVPITSADFPTTASRPGYSVLDKTETWKLLGAPAQHWRAELRNCFREYCKHG